MQLDHVAQVNEIIGGDELGDPGILHYFVNFIPMLLTPGTLFLDLSMWVPGHLSLVLS
jgi:hypothetical protein